MKVAQCWWTGNEGWSSRPTGPCVDTDLLLIFGATRVLRKKNLLAELRQHHPNAMVLGCSTAGEIQDVWVRDQSLVATAICFESTRLRSHQVLLEEGGSSREAGEAISRALWAEDLVHILILSDGLHVNGSELVAGLNGGLSRRVTVTGGLAGDGENMGHTLVYTGDLPRERLIAAVGFYGDRLKVGCGSLGGWDPFGPERKITKSIGNVLFELDGQSALSLYKKYLGEKASELPASGLLFPLSLRVSDGSNVVRTVLAVDESAQSMTFAGDLEEGAYVQLMKANFERLIDGAVGAARVSAEVLSEDTADLALLVSCVGRKLVLKQRVEEEVEAVREVLGGRPMLTGFYSLGEISPFTQAARCELHNQTMTVTTLAEI